MFHITRKGDYAVRAMVYMAAQGGDKIVLVRDISAEVDAPPALLAKVFQNLNRLGLVTSSRGRGGGFHLGRPAKDISLLEIIEAVDGPISINRCIIEKGSCGRESFCTVHPVWKKIQERIKTDLGKVSLMQLARKSV